MHYPVGNTPRFIISTSLSQFKPKGRQNPEIKKKINSIENYDEQKS